MPTHPEFLAAFADGITSGTLPPGLTAQVPGEAARRFAVYRNNVTVSLIDALGKRFPVIARLVGDDFFRAMARHYAEQHRPKTPVIHEWGDSFPDFLAGFEPLAAYPYMADVARIELARGYAYHAADAEPLSPALIAAAAASPETARLFLHPSVQVLQSHHPAVSIWRANQPGVAPGPIAAGGETALILRSRSFDVSVESLSAGDTAFLRAILGGERLLAAAEIARFADPDHDPQPILLHLMHAGAVVTTAEDKP
ncbi:MAG: DNA-binding domain-containing protein [Paracoccaceae bacterium]